METRKRKTSVDGRVAKRQKTSFVESTNPKNEDGISQCFHRVRTSMYVSLAPIYVFEPEKGVKVQHLDPLLMTYFAPVKGVVLAHYNLQFNGQDEHEDKDDEEKQPVVAKIMYDSPFAFMWISVDLLVWSPEAGDVLEGYINLQSPSHIGLLVHDTFNATIKRDAIPRDWVFEPSQVDEEQEGEEEKAGTGASGPRSLGYWIDSSGQRIDGKVQFTVRSFNVSGRTVSVQGFLGSRDLSERAPGPESVSLPSAQQTPAKGKHVTFEDEPSSSSSSEDGSVGTATNNNSEAEDSAPTYVDGDSDDESDDD